MFEANPHVAASLATSLSPILNEVYGKKQKRRRFRHMVDHITWRALKWIMFKHLMLRSGSSTSRFQIGNALKEGFHEHIECSEFAHRLLRILCKMASGDADTAQLEELFEPQKNAKNPLVPLGNPGKPKLPKVIRAQFDEVEAILKFDGSSKGNPGKVGAGGFIFISKENRGIMYSKGLSIKTNNEAEYLALLEGLEIINKYGLRRIMIQGDSNLVTKLASKIWTKADGD
eukprot:Gb_41391 [translate_table: standard]